MQKSIGDFGTYGPELPPGFVEIDGHAQLDPEYSTGSFTESLKQVSSITWYVLIGFVLYLASRHKEDIKSAYKSSKADAKQAYEFAKSEYAKARKA